MSYNGLLIVSYAKPGYEAVVDLLVKPEATESD